MGCQQEIAGKIVAMGGDYLLALKDNQSMMHRRAIEIFEKIQSGQDARQGMRHIVKKERRRGADELRTHIVIPVPKDFPASKSWKIRSLGTVARRRIEADGRETGRFRYYICSRPANVELFGQAVRAHWGIENNLHLAIDLVFTGDASRIRSGLAVETTAVQRRVALSKLQKDTSFVGSLLGKRKAAACPSTDSRHYCLENPNKLMRPGWGKVPMGARFTATIASKAA